METLPPPNFSAAIAAADSAQPQPPPGAKMRLMCSYGGHIVPRSHDKTLTYAGGDTRIVAVDRQGASLSSLTAHLSGSILRSNLGAPFVLKYQLPGHDLDSLVSVATEEDFENMLDEYDRVTNSPTPSRLRIFLFPAKPAPAQSPILSESDSESSWFLDALRSAKIGGAAKEGFLDGEGAGHLDLNVDSLEGGNGKVLSSGSPESIMLETSSSFGSTSSSVSMSNLPPIRAHAEDTGVGLDKKGSNMSPASGSTESDKGFMSAISHQQAGNCKDIIEDKVLPSHVELGANVSCYSTGMPVQEMVQVSGHPMTQQSDRQQELQYIPTSSHYISHQYPPTSMPVSSYYSMYPPQLHQLPQQQQQQQCSYQRNQLPYPIYIMPAGQTQAYNLPVHGNLAGPTSIASSQLPMLPNTSMVPPPVAYREVTAAQPPMPVLMSKVRTAASEPTPLNYVPSDRSTHQFLVTPQINLPSQATSAPVAAGKYSSEFDDDSPIPQIYKSQPLPPVLPPQHQTMSNTPTDLLSEPMT